jgi:hypothetical protein
MVDEGKNILGRLSKLGYHTEGVFQTEGSRQSCTQQTDKNTQGNTRGTTSNHHTRHGTLSTQGCLIRRGSSIKAIEFCPIHPIGLGLVAYVDVFISSTSASTWILVAVGSEGVGC